LNRSIAIKKAAARVGKLKIKRIIYCSRVSIG